MDHVYSGVIDARGDAIVHVDGTGPLDPRLDLANKSPTGFAWGYGGSGPSQLALALLAHHFQARGEPYADRRALSLFQQFKEHVVVMLPEDGSWTLTSEEIQHAVDAIERGRGAANA